MVFVPTVPYVPRSQSSLEAQELAREIEYVITEYQENHPHVRREDIKQALQIVRSTAGTGAAGRTVIMVAAVVGLTLLVVLATVFFVVA